MESERISNTGWPTTGRSDTAGADRRLMVGSLVAVPIGGLGGYFYGLAMIDGLAHAWTQWLMPAFINVYLLGIALCA